MYCVTVTLSAPLECSIENLYSPDKVHPVANNENKNYIKITKLTRNYTVIHTTRCDNKQYTMHSRSHSQDFFCCHGYQNLRYEANILLLKVNQIRMFTQKSEHGIGSGFVNSDHTCLCAGGDQTKLAKQNKRPC